MKVDIAGLKVDAISKAELLIEVISRIKASQKTWVTTVYSEFLYAALKDPKIVELLNKANIAVPDGIGIFWAKKYLEIPLSFHSPPLKKGGLGGVKYWLMVLKACWQIKYSLAAILFNSKWIKSALPEKIVGADLIWDLAKLASDNNLSMFLLGGHGDTPEIVAAAMKAKYSGLKFVGSSNKNPGDPSTITEINSLAPDILLVAYGPLRQEKWIFENLLHLNVKFAMGVGGSFDYIAGKKSAPPKFIRSFGLEWLWRLITQPQRFKRIINATFGLAWLLWHYKVFSNLPFRPNVATVITNKENKILVCQRNPKDFHVDVVTTKDNLKSKNYWQLPQGGVDVKEDLIAAARREAFEETGLKNLELFGVSTSTHSYVWNNALRGFWKNRDKANVGQKQNIVYFKFWGSDNEIKVDGEEFINYKWVKISELEKAVHPERLPLAKIIVVDLA